MNKPWVFYDGECGVCLGALKLLRFVLGAERFEEAKLQEGWVRRLFGLPAGTPPDEMKLLTGDRKPMGGVDALIYLAGFVWWLRPFHYLARADWIYPTVRRAYVWFAANRYCVNGVCALPKKRNLWAWFGVPLLAIEALWVFGAGLDPWVKMVVMAVSVYALLKGIVWGEAMGKGKKVTRAGAILFWFAWPGMDLEPFAKDRELDAKWEWERFARAVLWGLLGVAFYAYGTALANRYLVGWMTMIGIVLMLHFGLSGVIAWVLRGMGWKVEYVMNAPLLTANLAEFWGRRWNTAFSAFGRNFVFKRALRRLGPNGAWVFVFVISGLIHELAITVPAGGGYGLPTLYFLIQGLAVILAKTNCGFRLGINEGWRARFYAWATILGPLGLLFPEKFVLDAIAAMAVAAN
ncbi:MAG: MBOAT family protein [Verrucomicrobiota bacterium]